MQLWTIYFTGLEEGRLYLVGDDINPRHIAAGHPGTLGAHLPVLERSALDDLPSIYSRGSVAFINTAFIRAVEPVNPASYEVAK